MARIPGHDLPGRRTGRVHAFIVENDVHLAADRLIDGHVHGVDHARRKPADVARQTDPRMDHEAVHAVGLKVGNLAHDLLVLQVVVPEPERHDGEFARRVLELGQHVGRDRGRRTREGLSRGKRRDSQGQSPCRGPHLKARIGSSFTRTFFTGFYASGPSNQQLSHCCLPLRERAFFRGAKASCSNRLHHAGVADLGKGLLERVCRFRPASVRQRLLTTAARDSSRWRSMASGFRNKPSSPPRSSTSCSRTRRQRSTITSTISTSPNLLAQTHLGNRFRRNQQRCSQSALVEQPLGLGLRNRICRCA